MPNPTSTAAVVLVTGLTFDSEAPEYVVMTFSLEVNGPALPVSGQVTFMRNATQATKQTAVRQFVNAHIGAYEPEAAALTNANIQISGLPV